MLIRRKISSIAQCCHLPSMCLLCTQYHRDGLAVCNPCKAFFSPLGSACTCCALPLPDSTFLLCGPCIQKKPAVDKVMVAYRFEEPIRRLLHDFKYHEGLYLTSFLSTLIIDALPTEAYNTECLIPVPLHSTRLRLRGFNQAAELAKHLARRLNRPCALSLCQKTINTAPQASLSAKERHKNLQHAFKSEPIPYQHVTIVDDLLTTGSTANALARVLKNQGATRVDVWCCARVA